MAELFQHSLPYYGVRSVYWDSGSWLWLYWVTDGTKAGETGEEIGKGPF